MTQTKYLLALLLMSTQAQSATSWDQVAHSPDSGTTYYVDFSRITKTPTGFKVWAVVDDQSPDPKLHTLSLSYLLEVNCDEKKEQYSLLNGYDGPMAGGTILFSIHDASEWFAVKPNTVVDDRLRSICQTAPESIQRSPAKQN